MSTSSSSSTSVTIPLEFDIHVEIVNGEISIELEDIGVDDNRGNIDIREEQ